MVFQEVEEENHHRRIDLRPVVFKPFLAYLLLWPWKTL